MGKSSGGPFAVFKGKVGGVVGYRIKNSNSKAKQGLREYVTEVANPRTTAQNVQRGLFATVAKAQSRLYDIVNHSFENLLDGAECLAHFNKVNLSKLKNAVYTNYVFKGAHTIVPNEYILSEGSLLPIQLAEINGGNAVFSGVQASLKDGDDFTGLTFGDLRTAYPDFLPGDELLFVSIIDTDKTAVEAGNIKQDFFRVSYCRIVFQPWIDDDTVIYNGAEGWNDEALITSRVIGNPDAWVNMQNANGVFSLALGDKSEDPGHILHENEQVAAYAVIHSQQTKSGSWLYSTQSFVVQDGYWGLYDGVTAADTYGNSSARLGNGTQLLDLATARGRVSDTSTGIQSTIAPWLVSPWADNVMMYQRFNDFGKVEATGIVPSDKLAIIDVPYLAGSDQIKVKLVFPSEGTTGMSYIGKYPTSGGNSQTVVGNFVSENGAWVNTWNAPIASTTFELTVTVRAWQRVDPNEYVDDGSATRVTSAGLLVEKVVRTWNIHIVRAAK